ncbi:ejaculatory bulb-specific protein 3 [Solenopsis invicta]|uniref:ejaculatory bulb-specific protein 3 n=1 Tax=Solenopsis invicta TaxID=13686 RepID=UPI00193DEA26|nr:ejaculatory bulb-specific protein 3 [Solenopsis invicta]
MAQLNRIALIFIAMSVLTCVLAEELWFYSGEFDDMDVLSILEAQAEQEVDCYMKRGPCTLEQQRIADSIREAIRTNCRRCTPKQKQQIQLITDWYKSHMPQNWELIVANVDL